jgi:hypothetical protein
MKLEKCLLEGLRRHASLHRRTFNDNLSISNSGGAKNAEK